MRIVAILAAAVLGIAGAWLAFGRADLVPPSQCTMASLEPPPSAAPTVNGATVAWHEATIPEEIRGPGEQFIGDVSWFLGRFTAIGVSRHDGRSHTVMLTSLDGFDWRSDPSDSVRLTETELSRLSLAGGRLFALGSASTDDRGGSRAAVWSTDGQSGWTEATGPFDESMPLDIAAGDGHLLLIGSRNADGAPMAWVSNDGATWHQQPIQLPVPHEVASFSAVAALGDGWHATGSVGGTVDGPRSAVIWRSGDGVRWSCHVLDRAGFGVAGADDLHRSGAGWLATGMLAEPCSDTGACAGHGVAWTSDGLSWSDAQTSAPPSVGGTAVVGSDAGYLAIRGDATATSSDGFTWTIADSGGPGSQPEGLAQNADGLIVAVGADYREGGEGDGWIAVGELDR
jgi:hypothetical protein